MLPVGTNIEVTRPPKATLTLIAINIAVFVMEVSSPATTVRWAFDHLGFSQKNPNPVTLLTSLFLHGGFFHLFGNMLYLWIFGGPVEERIGARLFTYYYFGAGLWSSALWGLLAALANSLEPGIVIGASGAVSGIMALFLYRCYYGKLKMALPVLPTFIFAPWARFSIPAAPLLVYWFLRDIVGGVSSFSLRGGVAYWGHVGGWLVVGRIKRYGHEGQLEQAKAKLLKKIEEGFGWKTIDAEEELLKLTPRDPEIHHQLAHYYTEKERPKDARDHYQHAVNQYFLTDPVAGAYAVLEHFDVLKKPMALHHHLKAAEALVDKGYLEDAYRALKPAAEEGDGAVAERAGLLFIKVCRALDKRDEAEEGAKQFADRHPRSRMSEEAARVLTMKPEEVFPRKPAVRQTPARHEKEAEEAIGGRNPAFCIFQLARIYHRKLNDLGNALLHYKKLSEHAPPDHPYRGEAREVLKKPKRFNRS